MKIVKLSVAALCIAAFFLACQKDKIASAGKTTSAVTKADGNSEDPIATMFAEVRAKNTQYFKVNADEGGEVTGSGGTIIQIHGGALHMPDGTPASGTVLVKLIEVNDLADRALMGFPTQSRWTEQNPGSGGALVTAGSVDLTIETADGVQLTAEGDGVRIKVPIDPNEGFNPNASIWEGMPSVDQPRDNVWEQAPDEFPEHSEGYYLFNWDGRQKCNLDWLSSCPGTPTPFRVDIAGAYNKNNTEVYVVSQACDATNTKIVCALDVYNPSPIWWSEHTAAGIPVGTNVYFVAIAKVGGTLYSKIENATIVPNHFQHMTGMAPTTLAALTAALNAL